VAIGFDFCEFALGLLPAAKREELEAKLTRPHYLPDLGNHGHVRNLTRKLIERPLSRSKKLARPRSMSQPTRCKK